MNVLVLLSGGIDSTVALAWMLRLGFDVSAVGFEYGQPHAIELTRAQAVADRYRVPFRVVQLPHMPRVNDVVFAGRNLVFAATAAALAQAEGRDAIVVGCNASDWERFPDCRPAFWAHIQQCAEAYGVTVMTPLLHMSKAEVIERGRVLRAPLDLTWSCYAPQDGEPCGACLACETKQKAI